MTSKDIEMKLVRFYGIRQYSIIPNVSWGFTNMGEADLLVVSPSHYVTEIEIKISSADFRRDKDKHKWKMAALNENKFYSKRIKHFYYCMPCHIYQIVKDEIPEIAGVYTVGEGNNIVKEEKPAPEIREHRKLTDKELVKLYRLIMFRYWSLRDER